MAASRFEELRVWQKARGLAGQVYRATARDGFARDRGLREQVRPAAVSVMSNVAEGFERRGRREFARFLCIAQGSLGEVRSQLYLVRDLDYIDAAEFDALLTRCAELRRMIISLRKSQGT